MTRFPGLVLALAATALLVPAGGQATPGQGTTLHGRVGPGFTIVLTTEAGARVTKLDPGTYEIDVDDLSEEHNFHLLGPGVDKATEIADTGTVRWTVTLRDGTYTYQCDPHQGTMNGSFTVGIAPTEQPPQQKPPSAGTVTAKTTLVLTSGPGFTITLRTAAGKTVKTMRTGTYTVVVRDRSRIHNVHVVAPGFNRATTLPYAGAQTWKVKLARPGTFRFQCDPHALTGMKGSAKVVR